MNFTPVSAAIGGLLIGLAAGLLFRANGRIAGISGILDGAVDPSASDRGWRLSFLGGLLGGGWLALAFAPSAAAGITGMPWPVIVTAGVLVGFGTRLGSGCTSGHGICGLARLSPRSLVATLAFMSSGILTVYVVRHLLSGAW